MSPPYNSSPIVHSDTGQALAIATKALNIATTVLHSASLESEGGAATLPPTKSTRRARQSERAKRTKRNNPSGVKTLSEATRGTLEQKLGHIFENPDFLVSPNPVNPNCSNRLNDSDPQKMRPIRIAP
jgi:hypothetical protein